MLASVEQRPLVTPLAKWPQRNGRNNVTLYPFR